MRTLTLFAAIVATLALGGCEEKPLQSIYDPATEILPGDVVLRRGSGFTSHVVLFADKGGSYSHVGIAATVGDSIVIVHAVPDEVEHPADTEFVKCDPPALFFAPDRATIGCVMRCDDTLAARRAADIALEIWKRRTPFDHEYDGTDTTQMYCCELVEHAYAKAGHPIATAPRHNFHMPGMAFDSIMLPSDFRHSAELKVKAEF